MTYEELVNSVKEEVKRFKAENTTAHIAIEIDVRGEAEGAFYLELNCGTIHVEPYEYYDRDVLVITTANIVLAIARGEMGVEEAYRSGQLHTRGDVGKMFLFDNLVRV